MPVIVNSDFVQLRLRQERIVTLLNSHSSEEKISFEGETWTTTELHRLASNLRQAIGRLPRTIRVPSYA